MVAVSRLIGGSSEGMASDVTFPRTQIRSKTADVDAD